MEVSGRMPHKKKTPEELAVALRRRRREKQKILDAMPGGDQRLVKRGTSASLAALPRAIKIASNCDDFC